MAAHRNRNDAEKPHAHHLATPDNDIPSDEDDQQAVAGRKAGRPHTRKNVPHVDETPSGAYYIPSATYGQGVNGNVKRKRKSSKVSAVVAIIVVLCIIAGGTYLWINRPVDITLNGEKYTARTGTSLATLITDHKIAVTPGNNVSVSGNIIKEGKGEPFSANVNGRELSGDQLTSYGIARDDDITVGNGADITEDYTATTTEIQPKLKMEGTYGALAYVSQWGKVGKVEKRTGTVSGETCDVTVQEVQDCIITLHMPTPDSGQKIVAITFDDGPSVYTQRYLDILKQHNVKATFFQIGQNVREYPDLAKAVVEAGHQVACHSDTHPDLTTLDEATLQKELSQSISSIKNATGVDTTMLRPPYGSFREVTWLKSKGMLSLSVLWTQDSHDWSRPGADKIVSNSLAGIGSGSIILMHDGGGNRDQDLEALPQILETLQNQGYAFVTLSELMQSDSAIPNEIRTGEAKLPANCVWPSELGDA